MSSTCHQIIITYYFRTDKSTFKVCMDLTSCLWCLSSLLDCPCTNFRLTCCQITDQSKKMIACLDQLLKSGFFQSKILKEHSLLIII